MFWTISARWKLNSAKKKLERRNCVCCRKAHHTERRIRALCYKKPFYRETTGVSKTRGRGRGLSFLFSTSQAIFQFWFRQWDFRVVVEISVLYWRYKTMNFSLHYSTSISRITEQLSLKYFKSCFCQSMRLFRKDFQRNVLHSIQMPSLTKEFERMFISFSEIIVTRDMDWL